MEPDETDEILKSIDEQLAKIPEKWKLIYRGKYIMRV